MDSTKDLRQLRLRYPDSCELCGTALVAGSDALYDRVRHKARCLVCPPEPQSELEPEVDFGVAGGSARREFERRKARRESAARARYGERIGGFVAAVTTEPQSTRAWGDGARGEEILGAALAGVSGIVTLHDRQMPGSRANIDHIVIGPGGVFVVDAKRYTGRIEIRDKGGFFRSDLRLYIGRRDHSELADAVLWQAEAVAEALEATDAVTMPPVTPVLCFIDGDWPLRAPSAFGGVRLESPRTLKRLVTHGAPVDPRSIDWATRVLAAALPTK